MKKGIFLLLLFINSSLLCATFVEKTVKAILGRNKAKHLFFEQMKYGSDISNAYSERVALCPGCAALNIIIVFPLFYHGSSKISKKVTTFLTKKLLKHSHYHPLLQIPLTFISNEFFFNTFIFGYSLLPKLIAANCEYNKCDNILDKHDVIRSLCTAMFYPNTSYSLFIQKELTKRFFGIQQLGNNLFLHRSGVRLRAGTYQNPFSINRLQAGRQILQLYKTMFMIIFSKNRKAWVTKKIQKLKKIEDIPFYLLLLLGINIITTPQHIEQALQRATPYDAPPQRKKTNIELLFRPLPSRIPYAFAYVLYKILTKRSFTLSKESIKTSLTVKRSPYLIEMINAIKALKKIIVYVIVFCGCSKNNHNDDNNNKKIHVVKKSMNTPLDEKFLFDFLYRIVEKNTKEYFSPQQYYGMFLPCFKSFFACILCVEGFDKKIITKKGDRYYHKETSITPDNFTALLNDITIKKWAEFCINDTEFFKFLLTIEEKYVLVPKKTFTIEKIIMNIPNDQSIFDYKTLHKYYPKNDTMINDSTFTISISSYTDEQNFIFNLPYIKKEVSSLYHYYYQDYTERTTYYNNIKKINHGGKLVEILPITKTSFVMPYLELLNEFSDEQMQKKFEDQFNFYQKFELTDEDDAEYYGNPYYRYKISHM